MDFDYILCETILFKMKRKEINAFDYAPQILKALNKGVLLTSKADGKVNTMTIGWGTLGIEYNEPIFICFVREGRYTRQLIDRSGEFVVSIPYGEYDKKILGICGSRHGNEHDKIAEAKLTLVDGEAVSVPAIKELPLTLECKVEYRQQQDLNSMTDKNLREDFFPEDIPSNAVMKNKDSHIAYYGKIVKAYIIEED
jgi:flavin reductase (DIM6/NTAB) family NADH-FMN oxidoreductase RutF